MAKLFKTVITLFSTVDPRESDSYDIVNDLDSRSLSEMQNDVTNGTSFVLTTKVEEVEPKDVNFLVLNAFNIEVDQEDFDRFTIVVYKDREWITLMGTNSLEEAESKFRALRDTEYTTIHLNENDGNELKTLRELTRI